jgi:hypothetical protein
VSTVTQPSDKDIAEAKAAAMERFGSAALELVELGAPIDRSVLMAPFDRASWSRYIDALHRDIMTAHGQVFAERVVWPPLEAAMGLRDAWPALPSLVAQRLALAAGDVPELATVQRLSAEVRPKGLEAKDAVALLAGAGGAALWSVELPAVELSCVMRAPLPDTYLAAVAEDREARSKGTGVIETMARYLLDAVVWSASPMPSALERRPAILGDLRRAYLTMGGEGAAVRSKRL